MLPFLGPSTVRDAFARAADTVHRPGLLPRGRQHALHHPRRRPARSCAPACWTSTRSSNAATTATRSYAMPGCSAASTRSRTATSKTSRSSSKKEFKDDPRCRSAAPARPPGRNLRPPTLPRRHHRSRIAIIGSQVTANGPGQTAATAAAAPGRQHPGGAARHRRGRTRGNRRRKLRDARRPSSSATNSRAAPLRRILASSSMAHPSAP